MQLPKQPDAWDMCKLWNRGTRNTMEQDGLGRYGKLQKEMASNKKNPVCSISAMQRHIPAHLNLNYNTVRNLKLTNERELLISSASRMLYLQQVFLWLYDLLNSAITQSYIYMQEFYKQKGCFHMGCQLTIKDFRYATADSAKQSSQSINGKTRVTGLVPVTYVIQVTDRLWCRQNSEGIKEDVYWTVVFLDVMLCHWVSRHYDPLKC